MTFQSPLSAGSTAAEYSTYPEVVEAERAWDSPPQHYQPPSHLQQHYTQQQQQNMQQQQQQQQQSSFSPHSTHQYPPQNDMLGVGSTSAGTAGMQSPTMTTTTTDIGVNSKEAMAHETPSTPTTPLPGSGHGGEKQGPKRYSRKVVWFLIGLLILVMVLAGAIGGIVGSKAVKDAKTQCVADANAAAADPDNSTKPTSTPTTTAAPESSATSTADSATATFSVPTVGFVELACPSLGGTTTVVDMGPESWSFDLTCGSGFSRGGASDIMAVISYSFYHCMQACASLNANSGTRQCVGAEFDSDLSTSFTYGGNCFLSNSTSEVTAVGKNKNTKVSGVLKK